MITADKYIGEQIRKYRLLSGLTQEKLAKDVELTKQIISRIEKAERKVTYRELEKIAKELDQPIEAFTTIDFKNQLISRKHHSRDIPKFAIDFMDDWESYLRMGTNDDLAGVIMDAMKDEITEIYHKVYRTFKLR